VVEIGCGKFGERKSMRANQLATLVLRLLGIYCLIQVIPTIAVVTTAVSFVQAPSVDGKEQMLSNITIVMVAMLPLACRLVLGILLIARSIAWGERLTAKIAGQENIAAISFQQAQVLAFAVAGILIFADALPALFTGVFNLATWLKAHANHSEYQDHATLRSALTALGALARALLGLGLFFCSHGFANFWRSLRNFGTPKPPAN
jgi:hypothetical protein